MPLPRRLYLLALATLAFVVARAVDVFERMRPTQHRGT